MKKILTLAILTGLFCQQLFAQLTQAEIDKQIKAAQLEIEKMKKDPKNKELMKNMPNMDSLMKNMQKGNNQAATKNIKTGTVSSGLPERNNKLLSQLPKKTLTRNELATYLNTLDVQLTQQIKSTSADSVKLTVRQLGNDGEKLSYAAMVAWYKNDAEAAVMLASKAATLSIDNDAALSNCAAIFIMAGLENKAIPILQVLLQRQPNSSTVLNNIGQAYTGLGEVDTAMYYFGRCIKIAPTHPEANNTAAIICMKKGQTEQAKNYCTQSLKGGLTPEAVKTYGHLFKNDDIEKLIDIEPWKSYPFNEHDFTFPLQCEKTEDAAKTKLELDAYEKRYRDLFGKYEKGYIAEMRSKAAKMSTQFAKNSLENMWMADSETPYSRRALYAYHRIGSQLFQEDNDVTSKHHKEIDNLKIEYTAKKNELETKQTAELMACGQNNLCMVKVHATYCRLQDELSNQYLPKFAVINRDYVSKIWRVTKEKFEAYSMYIKMAIKHNTILFFSEEATRISSLFSDPLLNGEIFDGGYKVIMPYCDMTQVEMERIDSLELKENKNCNLNVELPLGPVKMTFSCDEYEIEGGELIKAKYNKNFRTGQTTLYAGVGVSEHIPGFEASATQYVFVCFDKNNKPVDVGTQGELELDVKGVVKGDQKIILKTSMNTGVSFEPGPLQALTDVLPYAFK